MVGVSQETWLKRHGGPRQQWTQVRVVRGKVKEKQLQVLFHSAFSPEPGSVNE